MIAMEDRKLRSADFLVYVVPPALAMILALPVALIVAPWNLPYVKLTWFHVVILAPFYVGLLAAPGYLYVLFNRPKRAELVPRIRWWVRLSLWLAVLCSAGGVVGGYWMILFAIPSFPAVIVSIRLLYEFERS